MTQKKWMLGAALLIGAAVLLRKKGGRGPASARKGLTPPPGMKWQKVGKNEKVSAGKFETLGKKRPGGLYAPAKLLPNGRIEFASPRAGNFTGYVLQTGGKVFAEIA